MWTLTAASLAFIAIAGASQLWSRLRAPDPFEYRREFARSTLAMIAERPWRGFGLGTFAAVYPAFAEFDPGAAVTHAHNDWLEWSSEGGVPFAAAWFLLAIALLRPAVRSVWGIGLIAVLLHALVDFPFARFGIGAWFFVLAGALSVKETARRREIGAANEMRVVGSFEEVAESSDDPACHSQRSRGICFHPSA